MRQVWSQQATTNSYKRYKPQYQENTQKQNNGAEHFVLYRELIYFTLPDFRYLINSLCVKMFLKTLVVILYKPDMASNCCGVNLAFLQPDMWFYG